jgi:hypothetical protein
MRLACDRRRGATLVEFAVIALVLYFLLAFTLELGRGVFAAQVVNQAADTAARELARVPLPAGISFKDALKEKVVKDRIFDEAGLVVEITGKTPAQVDEQFEALPVVNRQLRPLMVPDTIGGKEYLRYPGAVVSDPEIGLTVMIPRVVSRGADGVETIDWLPVLEEVKEGEFAFKPSDRTSGRVFVRINYPFQAASLSAFRQTGTPTVNQPVLANDGGVTVVGPAPGSLVPSDKSVGPYAGSYGLGRQLALGQTLRPFRKVLSEPSGSYAREILEPDEQVPPPTTP